MITHQHAPRRYLWLSLFLLLLPALACGLFDDDEDLPDTAVVESSERPALPPAPVEEIAQSGATASGVWKFEIIECPFESFDADISCGYLHVPEDRRQSGGRTIQLAVAIISSTNANPQPDPIIYLSGGPGDSALADLDSWLESPLRDHREIILLDQRGTGFSLPGLHCPEMEDEEADMMVAAQSCRNRLAGEGINLSAYNSAASAADVRDLRLALGYQEWNLLGISYGTRLALTVMRDYPEGIRSVVLDSVYPPNADGYTEQPLHIARAIHGVLDGCAADAACDEAFPDLPTLFYELLAELQDYPLEFEDGTILDGDLLIDQLTQVLYETSAISLIPYALYEAYYENYDPLFELLAWDEDYDYDDEEDTGYYFEEDLSDSEGAFYSVECYDEITFGDFDQAWELVARYPEEMAERLIADLAQMYDVCEIWDVEEPGAIETAAVVSTIPTLILVGEFDPVTPPEWGRLAGRTLSNHYLFEIPRGGHALIDAGNCPLGIVVAFINNPRAQPDGRCLAPLPFVLP